MKLKSLGILTRQNSSHKHFQVSKEFFPDVAIGYEDPRVKLHIGDGIRASYPVITIHIF